MTAQCPRMRSGQARQPRAARRREASGLTRAQPWTNRKNHSLSGYLGATTATSVPTDSGSVSRNCNWLHRAGDRALRRRSIKLLFAGFRLPCFRLGASPLSERRASGVARPRSQGQEFPTVAPSPALCSTVCAEHDVLDCGSFDGCDLSRAPRRSQGLRASAAALRRAVFSGVALSNTLDNRTRATCDLSGSFAGLAIMRWARRVARSPTETPPSRGQLRR